MGRLLRAAALLSAALAVSSAAAAPGDVPGAVDTPTVYGDSWHGWPIAPVHRAHGVYGSFLNPDGWRNYHVGIDIPVNDAAPEPAAPEGRSHRVYAVEGGVVRYASTDVGCDARRVWLAHFTYGHVDPTVGVGDVVRAGDPIGWSCTGSWHVHLGELAVPVSFDDRATAVWLNPLRPGGKLAPLDDDAPPVIHGVRFATPTWRPLDPSRLSGRVNVAVLADDPFPPRDWPKAPRAPLHVYSLTVEILTPSGRVVMSHEAFRIDTIPGPMHEHFAPGTYRNLPVRLCAVYVTEGGCEPAFWLQALRSWDTRTLASGRYVLRLVATDESGNVGTATRRIVIAHGRRLGRPPR